MERKAIIARLMKSVAWIQNNRQIYGTGWVLDKKRRLLITNQHVISGAKEIEIYFPIEKNSQWINDPSYYTKNVTAINAKIIHSNRKIDLALLQLDKLPEGIEELSLVQKSAQLGDQLHSVGSFPMGSNALWVYTFGVVRQVNQGMLASGYTARIVQAQLPINKGTSGGPVLNDDGKVVAVVEGLQLKARDVTMCIDVTELKKYLKKSLSFVEPKTTELLAERGEEHYFEKRYDDAIRDLSQAIRKNSNLPHAYAYRGWSFYKKGDSQTALGDFNDAIRLDKTLRDAYYGRGLVQRELKNTSGSIKDLTNAIRIDPNFYRLYNQRGITYYRSKQFRPAFDDFTRAVELKPRDGQLHANVGDAAVGLRWYAKAALAYAKAFQRLPRRDDIVNMQGVSEFRLGKYERSTKAFQKAISLNPRNDLYRLNLADSHRNLGRYNISIELYNRALRLNSKRSSTWYGLGVSHYRLKEYQSAVKDFSKAISLSPKHADSYYYRSLAWAELGKQDFSVVDFRKATELNPGKYNRQVPVDFDEPEQGDGKSNHPGKKMPIVGFWKFRKSSPDETLKITTSLKSNGEYFSKTVRDYSNGQTYSSSEKGTYFIKSSRLVITTKSGTVRRKFGFKNGQLWVEFPEDDITIHFVRVK